MKKKSEFSKLFVQEFFNKEYFENCFDFDNNKKIQSLMIYRMRYRYRSIYEIVNYNPSHHSRRVDNDQIIQNKG